MEQLHIEVSSLEDEQAAYEAQVGRDMAELEASLQATQADAQHTASTGDGSSVLTELLEEEKLTCRAAVKDAKRLTGALEQEREKADELEHLAEMLQSQLAEATRGEEQARALADEAKAEARAAMKDAKRRSRKRGDSSAGQVGAGGGVPPEEMQAMQREVRAEREAKILAQKKAMVANERIRTLEEELIMKTKQNSDKTCEGADEVRYSAEEAQWLEEAKEQAEEQARAAREELSQAQEKVKAAQGEARAAVSQMEQVKHALHERKGREKQLEENIAELEEALRCVCLNMPEHS